MDLEAAEAAGIRDAAARAPLLEYLESRGFSLEDMVAAEGQGRLFALSGDVFLWSGPPTHSLRTAAEVVGRPLDEVAHAWAVLGLTVADRDQIALSEADVDVLATWAELARRVGDDPAYGLLRVVGATMARLAEAESSVMRAGLPDTNLRVSADELRTAQVYADIAQLVPRVGRAMDAVHRQHLQSVRTYFETVAQEDGESVMIGVGFADLSGFTSMTQQLTLGELSGLLSAFTTTASDVVHEHGGRLVKLLGDAVMWVNADVGHLAQVAAHLVRHPLALQSGIGVRAGLAFGPALALDGDYFGSPVNLAARLVAAAGPGQILAPDNVRAGLPEWIADALEPVTLRGFDAPVVPYNRPPTRLTPSCPG